MRFTTPKGSYLPEVRITSVEVAKLDQYSLAFSPTCPVTITFDRDTGVISKAKLECDPLALLDLQNNEG